MKTFNVPQTYRSTLISAIKNYRKQQDKLKKDFSPTLLPLEPLQIYLARHFGFCYGVENAIEIAYRTIDENPGKRIFLLSEMIHNPQVNADLQAKGVSFLQNTHGEPLMDMNELNAADIVIIPAFGTTLAIEAMLNEKGISTQQYNTTCPFVEKVWNRSKQIATKQYSIVIHGKPLHEETRATFSRTAKYCPTIVVADMKEAKILTQFINGQKPADAFYEVFKGQYSEGFDVTKDLQRIGVVNQTTMLASDTQAIADVLKQSMVEAFSLTQENIEAHFADTRDTLCYATNDNQTAVSNMLTIEAHLAIVIGGYNSSNTSHLVELCEEKLPTYYIDSAKKMLDKHTIIHYDFHTQQEKTTQHFLPMASPAKILITSGASCPDALVEGVIRRIADFYDVEEKIDALVNNQFC
jgi:4-hydroxy-3-methylbut-2-en-1-yl diphosphate reductase